LQKLIIDISGIEETIKGLKPQEAIGVLENKIAECEQWKEENRNYVRFYYKPLFSDLYFLLAKAKEAGGLPKKDVVDAYEKATSSYNKAGEVFLWLFSNVPPERYTSIVKTFAQNDGHNYHNISKQLESGKNWPVFKSFLDTVFSSVENPTAVAKSIGNSLGVWKGEYLEYCKSKAQLTEYIFEKDYEAAEQYIAKKDFKGAADVYRNIIKQCGTYQDKTGLELKVCRCILGTGDYQNAIIELGRFIDRNKASDKKSVKEAVLMKSQCYIQLGDPNKALDEFAKLTAEYPETKWTAEFGFYTAYCYMLQGKSDKAAKMFSFVVQNYPESSYANQATLCLDKIKGATEGEKDQDNLSDYNDVKETSASIKNETEK
jgi:tetratricopeptide (TPR) repeat protein